MIRFVTPADAVAICRIYNAYVTDSVITFEEEVVTSQDMQQRILSSSNTLPWLVSEINGVIAGYAYASEWKSRCAFRFSVETSVYLSSDHQGRGIGYDLYSSLISKLRETSCHSLISGIALPNEASIALHEKCHFKKIGHFKEVGRKFDQWIDVGYWQRILTSN